MPDVLVTGADLLGAGRADLLLRDGRFADDFAPYAVHLYRIGGAPRPAD